MRVLFFVFVYLLCIQTAQAKDFDQSHKIWDTLLKKYVTSEGLVAYKEFQKDNVLLEQYLGSLSQVSEEEYKSFTKSEKLAFLINAYNAFTIRLILDHYPVKSISDIGGPLPLLNLARGAPWKKNFFSLLGETRNLDWIEHQKLRKDFSEPRIHFAIVCASLGCPLLKGEAYTGKQMEIQLKTAKLSFLRDPKKNSYDSKKNILYLSKIFDWFKEDFTKQSTLIEFIQEGFEEKIKIDALVEFNEYSWKLNEKK
ncbi:hypothetical protein LPTSP4_35540 [Leptospira ryugenii]|uniref:DUF547 domain-containing protein n=1 Tax=Leptospira ryugenii TaxID=1917863 RepID=A0A2P2E568_9LEPT|nr:DUF547 domain-containing protein [Leptospira ryugenii]GBF52016.1 hypothetical protein LPTSP4_35540 [Leptospira ryugenii]